MKYILLTGGTGFIGSHIVERLLNENYKLLLVKRSSSNLWRINHLLDNANLVLVDNGNLKDIFTNYSIEGVFHLATHYIKNHEYQDIESIIESNIEFPSKLIDLSVNADIKYFINTGTFFEYNKTIPLSETSIIHPFNFYSSTKIAFEDILKYYFNEYDINIATLKLFTPYGPRDDVKKIIPYLIINLLNNNEVKINNPNNYLDIVHVSDIAEAYLKLKDKILKFRNYEVFNVSNDISYSIGDILSVIKFNLNLQNKPTLNPKVFANSSKINSTLNWKPELDIFEGINNTIDYYKQR